MPVYMCRWENGEVSFVGARSKRDACLLLDEFAAVEPEDLHEVREFMLGFTLSDDGGVMLSDLGEATRELFEEKIYPVLYQAKQESGVEVDEPVKDGGPEIRAAIEKERTRLQGQMRKGRAKSSAARTLQEELGMSATVAERHEQIARGKQDKRKLQ